MDLLKLWLDGAGRRDGILTALVNAYPAVYTGSYQVVDGSLFPTADFSVSIVNAANPRDVKEVLTDCTRAGNTITGTRTITPARDLEAGDMVAITANSSVFERLQTVIDAIKTDQGDDHDQLDALLTAFAANHSLLVATPGFHNKIDQTVPTTDATTTQAVKLVYETHGGVSGGKTRMYLVSVYGPALGGDSPAVQSTYLMMTYNAALQLLGDPAELYFQMDTTNAQAYAYAYGAVGFQVLRFLGFDDDPIPPETMPTSAEDPTPVVFGNGRWKSLVAVPTGTEHPTLTLADNTLEIQSHTETDPENQEGTIKACTVSPNGSAALDLGEEAKPLRHVYAEDMTVNGEVNNWPVRNTLAPGRWLAEQLDATRMSLISGSLKSLDGQLHNAPLTRRIVDLENWQIDGAAPPTLPAALSDYSPLAPPAGETCWAFLLTDACNPETVYLARNRTADSGDGGDITPVTEYTVPTNTDTITLISTGNLAAGFFYTNIYGTPTRFGTINGFYGRTNDSNVTVKLQIYSLSAGTPDALLWESDEDNYDNSTAIAALPFSFTPPETVMVQPNETVAIVLRRTDSGTNNLDLAIGVPNFDGYFMEDTPSVLYEDGTGWHENVDSASNYPSIQCTMTMRRLGLCELPAPVWSAGRLTSCYIVLAAFGPITGGTAPDLVAAPYWDYLYGLQSPTGDECVWCQYPEPGSLDVQLDSFSTNEPLLTGRGFVRNVFLDTSSSATVFRLEPSLYQSPTLRIAIHHWSGTLTLDGVRGGFYYLSSDTNVNVNAQHNAYIGWNPTGREWKYEGAS